MSLFSKSVAELLQNSDHATALSCPVKKNQIDTLLNVLENHNHDDDIIGNEAFGILGIEQLDITTDIQFQSVSKIDPNRINTSVVDKKPTFVEEIHQGKNNVPEEPIQSEKHTEEINVSNTFRCHLCDSQHEFRNQFLLQKHLSKKHGLEITCHICSDAFQQYDQFVTHINMCKQNITCQICHENFKTKAELKCHKSNMHDLKKFMSYLW